jgi:chemotaxis protein MotB
MKRSGTRSLRRTEALALCAAFGLVAAGCVTRGRYDEVVGGLEQKNSRLEARVHDLELSNQSLDEERVKLIDEMEDLRETRASLSQDVEQLSKTRDLLTEHLRKRESEVAELSQLKGTYSGLVTDLEAEVAAGQIQIEQLRDGIRLNLPEDILFASGSAALDPRGEKVLRKVASKLRENNHRIEVRGHTDNVPLAGALAARFGTNWELAAARAARVVRLFQEEKIAPERLSVVSYGEYAPVASNDDAEGRARNRRIEIRLIPIEKPEVSAEAKAPAPAAPQASPAGAPAAPPASAEPPPGAKVSAPAATVEPPGPSPASEAGPAAP